MTQTGQTGGYGTASRERPGIVTAAAIVLIVIGALGTVGGLLGLVGGGLVAGFGGGLEFFFILALVGLIVAILALVAGIGILTGKSWGRNLGIGVSVAAILLSVVSAFLTASIVSQIEQASGVSAAGGDLLGGIGGVVITVLIYGFVIWALTKEKDYFAG